MIESPFLISTNAMRAVRFGAPEGPTRCGLNRRLMFVQPLSANLRTRRGFCCPIATGRQWMEGQWVDRRMAREWLMMGSQASPTSFPGSYLSRQSWPGPMEPVASSDLGMDWRVQYTLIARWFPRLGRNRECPFEALGSGQAEV